MAKKVTAEEYVAIYKDHLQKESTDSLIAIGEKLGTRTFMANDPPENVTVTNVCGKGLKILYKQGSFECDDCTPELYSLIHQFLWAGIKLNAVNKLQEFCKQYGIQMDWPDTVECIDEMDELVRNDNDITVVYLRDCVVSPNPIPSLAKSE